MNVCRTSIKFISSYWLRFLEQAFDAAIEFGEWGKAIEWGARIIPAYKLVSERPQRNSSKTVI